MNCTFTHKCNSGEHRFTLGSSETVSGTSVPEMCLIYGKVLQAVSTCRLTANTSSTSMYDTTYSSVLVFCNHTITLGGIYSRSTSNYKAMIKPYIRNPLIRWIRANQSTAGLEDIICINLLLVLIDEWLDSPSESGPSFREIVGAVKCVHEAFYAAE